MVGENLLSLFSKKSRIDLRRLFNPTMTFSFGSTDLNPCNCLNSLMKIISISLLPISLFVFHKKSLLVLSISVQTIFKNFKLIHRELKNTLEIRFNQDNFTCVIELNSSARQFSSKLIFIPSMLK